MPRMDRTDAELIALARDDGAALGELYRRHAGGLARWLEREVRSEAVALDLTAETFARALVGLRRFRDEGDGSAAPWLYGIARNLLADYRRRGAVERRARQRLAMRLEWSAEDDDAVRRVDAERLAPRLDSELASLPADQRAAVVARLVDEQSYADLARESEVSEAAVRQRVARGLRNLRARLRGGQP